MKKSQNYIHEIIEKSNAIMKGYSDTVFLFEYSLSIYVKI